VILRFYVVQKFVFFMYSVIFVTLVQAKFGSFMYSVVIFVTSVQAM
jgi:hypothetical protein